MAVLSKGAIFSVAPAQKEIEIPEWGGSIIVRAHTLNSRIALADADTINADAVIQYERDQALDEDDRQGLAKVERYDQAIINIIFSVIDENGDFLFSIDDHDRLKELGYGTLITIMTAINDVNSSPQPSASISKKKKPSA
jgi:hypothetical protein